MAGHRDGALWGSFVGDALAMGPHWVYDIEKLREHYGSISGYTTPDVMDYHAGRQPGEFTHLGDQAFLLLRSIQIRGGFDRNGWASDWQTFFESYDGYFDAATKQTLRHLQAGDPAESAGSDSTELAGATRIGAIVHRYWDDPVGMMEAARDQTSVTHNTAMIIDCARFIVHTIEAVKQGKGPVTAMRAAAAHEYRELPAREWIEQGFAAADTDSTEAIGEFGRACDVSFAFPSVAQLVARYEDDFQAALIANTEAGGDSAARGLALGLILGAYHGVAAIPAVWITGVAVHDQIAAFAEDEVTAG